MNAIILASFFWERSSRVVKVQFNYRVDSNTAEEWRKLVVSKEGYAYRFLCSRLEKILKADIVALRTSTQYTTSTQRIDKQAAIEVKNKIIEWMITPGSRPDIANTALYEGEGDPRFILEKHLLEAIKVVTGKIDDRTCKNWIKRLKLYNCIKHSGPHQYEFIWKEDEVKNV
jgi:hypothetical protein